MSEQTGTPPAGWYSDPSNPNQQRWWDGVEWSASTRPLTDGPHPTGPPVAAGGGQGFNQPPTIDPAVPTAPTTQPMAPGSVSAPGTRAPVVIEPGRNRSATKIVLGVVGAMFVLGGCVTLFASSNDPADDRADDLAADDVEVEPAADTTPATPVEAETVETQPPTVPDAVEEPEIDNTGRFGTRETPLAYDQPVDVVWDSFGDGDGSVWTTTIGPPRDITEEVLATNQFNDPPPDGVRFVGFEVELTLVESAVEPLAPGFNISWEILGGATARVYGPTTVETESFGCGVTPGSFDDFAEAFAGGTLSGTVCIPIPTEDLDHPDTRVAIDFSDGDRAIFGP